MEEAAWMDIDGNTIGESDAYGCNFNVNITDSDWVLVMDKVGGNTNEKGDGNNGHELQIYE